MRNALLSVLKKHPFLCCALCFTIIIAVLLALLPPVFLQSIVDGLTEGKEVTLKIAVWYFALLALGGLVSAGREVLITVLGQKMTHAIRSEMCQKLDRLPAAYFTTHASGEVSSRFVNDVEALSALFDNGVISMAADACQLIGILIVIFTRSIGMGFLMLLITPFVFLLTRLFQKKMLRAQIANRSAIARVNDHIPQTMRCRRMIRCLSKQHYMEKKYDFLIGESYRAVEESNFCDAAYSPLITMISTVMIALLMLFAAGGKSQTLFGLSVGGAVAMIAYISQFFSPVESLGMEIQNIQSAAAGVRRIRDFLKEAERVLPTATISLADAKVAACAVSFVDVTFGYDEKEPVLEHFSMRIAPRERVTLAGRTGVGKSTAFKLILGLYTATFGKVLVFGVEAQALKDSEKRHLIGYVEQSFAPVDGSIRTQITLNDPLITEEQMRRAVDTVGLTERIAALPNGYDTPFSSTLFSRGQLQLLSIARAIAAEPPLLLLDEITADLDSATEDAVLRALENASQARTVLSISHRLFEKTGQGRMIQM